MNYFLTGSLVKSIMESKRCVADKTGITSMPDNKTRCLEAGIDDCLIEFEASPSGNILIPDGTCYQFKI